jgi:hypothetical protein
MSAQKDLGNSSSNNGQQIPNSAVVAFGHYGEVGY